MFCRFRGDDDAIVTEITGVAFEFIGVSVNGRRWLAEVAIELDKFSVMHGWGPFLMENGFH